MKTVIIDKNAQSKEFLINTLKNIENIEFSGSFDDFCEEIDFADINLVIFDIKSDSLDEVIKKITDLKSKYENLKFIAQSYEINSKMVSKILSAGANDFVLKPVIPSILEASIKKINFIEEKKAISMCVFSNKGGVGKTSFATNLAWEIYNKTDSKIAILDLGFNNEDISEFLNIEQKYDIDYILQNLEQSNEKLLLSLMGKYKDTKIYVLETKEKIMQEAKYTPQKITKIINSLKNIFDYVIIDTSSIINENAISIFNCSDIILLISSMNIKSIKNCQKCYELFDKIGYGDDKIKLIINRFIENQEFTLKDVEKTLNKNVFNTIPNNYLTLVDAINQGQNVGEINPQSNIAKAYSKIAQDILNIDFTALNNTSCRTHGIFNLLHRMGDE